MTKEFKVPIPMPVTYVFAQETALPAGNQLQFALHVPHEFSATRSGAQLRFSAGIQNPVHLHTELQMQKERKKQGQERKKTNKGGPSLKLGGTSWSETCSFFFQVARWQARSDALLHSTADD